MRCVEDSAGHQGWFCGACDEACGRRQVSGHSEASQKGLYRLCRKQDDSIEASCREARAKCSGLRDRLWLTRHGLSTAKHGLQHGEHMWACAADRLSLGSASQRVSGSVQAVECGCWRGFVHSTLRGGYCCQLLLFCVTIFNLGKAYCHWSYT